MEQASESSVRFHLGELMQLEQARAAAEREAARAAAAEQQAARLAAARAETERAEAAQREAEARARAESDARLQRDMETRAGVQARHDALLRTRLELERRTRADALALERAHAEALAALERGAPGLGGRAFAFGLGLLALCALAGHMWWVAPALEQAEARRARLDRMLAHQGADLAALRASLERARQLESAPAAANGASSAPPTAAATPAQQSPRGAADGQAATIPAADVLATRRGSGRAPGATRKPARGGGAEGRGRNGSRSSSRDPLANVTSDSDDPLKGLLDATL